MILRGGHRMSKLLRYRNGTWIVDIREEKPVKKEEKKVMRRNLKPNRTIFPKIEDWLQKRSYWMNIIFASVFGVSLALNIFQYKVIQFYKKLQETIIINGGF